MTTYSTSEVLTINGLTPVQSTASLVDNIGGARASSVIICPKTNPVDFTFVDGADPAAGTSVRIATGTPYTINGYNNIKNATYFNTDGNPATLYCQYSYGN